MFATFKTTLNFVASLSNRRAEFGEFQTSRLLACLGRALIGLSGFFVVAEQVKGHTSNQQTGCRSLSAIGSESYSTSRLNWHTSFTSTKKLPFSLRKML